MSRNGFRVDDVDPRRRIPFKFPFLFKPHPLLSRFVRRYWLVVVSGRERKPVPAEPKPVLLVPDGGSGLLFSRDYGTGGSSNVLLGVMDGPETVFDQRTTGQGMSVSFGIDFAPGGLSRFFDDSMVRYLNLSTPLEAVSPEVFGGLSRDLPNARSAGEQIRIVESFLFHRLDISKPRHPAVSTALDLLARSSGRVSVERLARDCSLSPRTLNRLFTESVGLSAKTLGRIIRLQKALAVCRTRNDRDYLRIALEAGYYDQPHFIRDFREFTGMTPGSYFSSR